MRRNRLMLVALLLLAGCGSCQNEEAPTGGGAVSQPAATANIPAPAGKIQVAPVQPTIAARQAPPAGAAPAVSNTPAAGEPAAAAGNEEEDCIVVADADPDYGPPPLAVGFSAEAECNAGQPSYKWDFGDGSASSAEVNPTHTYTKPGDYTATVTVTGANGATSSDEIDITVEEPDEGGE